MTLTADANRIFDDATQVYNHALKQLQQDDLRDAAEKAWCATKRATDAMILALTNKGPRTSGQTMEIIRKLRKEDEAFEPLRRWYGARQTFLHGACFYDGICKPEDDLITDIQETIQYIQEAKDLAASYTFIDIMGWSAR